MARQFVNTDEAAAHVGLRPGTMRNMRIRGSGPRFAKLGATVRYSVDDLDAWVGARMVNSTSEKASA